MLYKYVRFQVDLVEGCKLPVLLRNGDGWRMLFTIKFMLKASLKILNIKRI